MHFLAAIAGIAVHHAAQTDSGGPSLQLWQVINLVGAPLLALIFARPVVEDLKSWWSARGSPGEE